MSESNNPTESKEKKKKKSIAKTSDLPKKEKEVSEARRKSSTKPEEISSDVRRKSSTKPEEISSDVRRKSSAIPEESSVSPVTAAPKEDLQPKNIEEPKQEPVIEIPPKAPKKTNPIRKESLEDLDENKIRELKEAFELFDLNHDGIIDINDLKSTYLTLGRLDVPDSEMNSMLAEASNPLDFDSFVELLGFRTIELDPEEILVEALSQWDYDNSGYISEERIKHDLMTWGDRFTKQEVEYALEDAPTIVTSKGIPMIDYVSFCKILCGLRKKTKSPCPEDFMKNF